MRRGDAINIRAADLFCGIGGLTHGLRLAGIDVKAGFDNDPSCRFAYEANNPGATFTEADARTLSFSDFKPHFQDADVTALVGCAPCQPFSAHTRRQHDPDADDCSLVGEFARLIEEGLPDLVSMENVPGLAKHEAFGELRSRLTELDYEQDCDVVSCADYGVPQNRKRLVLVASRLGKISLPSPSPVEKTVRDFIDGLPPIGNGSAYAADPAHACMPLSETNLSRIQQSKPGGSWRDWEAHLVSKCHTKSYYPAPYGRMSWDALAPTITTQFCYYSTGRFGHPTQDRAISVREGALLQTFPRDYELIESPDHPPPIHKLARQIGNAVPVTLAQAIGETLMEAAHAGR